MLLFRELIKLKFRGPCDHLWEWHYNPTDSRGVTYTATRHCLRCNTREFMGEVRHVFKGKISGIDVE